MSVGLTIATRYCAVRKQFGPTEDSELPVIEYQSQVCIYNSDHYMQKDKYYNYSYGYILAIANLSSFSRDVCGKDFWEEIFCNYAEI